ncbi:hypothetical protein V5799_023753 [Amblyomma americanum]|uniref:TPM domain-containing protein n=1 Tax=Amblyomma americanum TaxID=6943 RepID=A0AAQ4FGM0_AMBAM
MRESGGGPLAAILAALLCSCAPLAVSADSWCSAEDEDPDSRWYWRVDEYPHPITQPRYCNRYRASFVCDPDRVINKKQADSLDWIIERIRNETLCICPTCGKSQARGITLGVAIMEHIHRPHNLPISEAVRLFAERLRKQWGLGHCDDDILLLISTKDKQSHTLVGPAVSGVFPQEVADQIYLESRGHFSNCDFYEGLESMVQSYFDMLRRLQLKGLVGARVQPPPGTSAGVIVGIVFGALALMLLAVGAVLLVVRRCDAQHFSTKSIPEALRRMRQLRPARHRHHFGRHNSKAATAPSYVRAPTAAAVAAATTPVAQKLTTPLAAPPPKPPRPPQTATLSNGCYASPSGVETPHLNVSDASDSSDDERSTSDNDGECTSCESEAAIASTPGASCSSARTHATV